MKTWDDAVAQWILESQHKASLKDDISRAKWLTQYFSGMALKDMTREVIMGALQAKRNETSNTTANRHLALVRAILRRARDEWEWIERIPKLRQWQEPLGRTRWLTADEVNRLLAALPPLQNRMVRFALAVGQRQGAIKGLRWDDIRNGICSIKPAMSKNRRAIPVPLNDAAKEVLRECQALQWKEGIEPEFVFTHHGKPVHNVNTKAWRDALKTAGIEDFRWHDLRHTWASHHASNGTPMVAIKEMGGWANMKMVERYAHLSQEALRKYANNAALK
jgi:integrase